jgi:predicted transcriptional regulator
MGNSEGKRPLGRPKRRLQDNIKMNLGEIEWGVMEKIDLLQDRDQWRARVNMVMNRLVPKKCWEILL